MRKDSVCRKQAVSIGTLCISTYLFNYYLRNLLSVLTPQMLETGRFTVESIGILSSAYMGFYAVGQLINGFLGDLLSPKKMICCGTLFASMAVTAFSFANVRYMQLFCFAVLGFALSMVRGPMMKIISENTSSNHARMICVFFSFTSYAGPLAASLSAFVFGWKEAFWTSGILGMLVSGGAYAFLSRLERKKIISYQSTKRYENGGFLKVFRIEKFAFYMLIACLTESGMTAVSFWIPTYLTGNIGFSKDAANMIYSIISTTGAFMPFVTLILFRIIKERDILMLRFSFLITTVMFGTMLFVEDRWLSVILLMAARMSIACSSALLWSIYIPRFGKTGKVSSINGILDCSGYVAAAVSNMIFAGMMKSVGWIGVLGLWTLLGIIGVIVTSLQKGDKMDGGY